ncbi:MAG: DUF1697 domain-containing protein [Solirubrobacterales bacterium]
MPTHAAFLRAVDLGATREAPSEKLRSIFEGLGFEVPTFIRSARELKTIASHSPFPAKAVKASKGKLQVALLERKPTAAGKRRVTELASDDDLLAVKGTELYWLPSGGTQQSGLNMKAIDQALGLNTIRTQGTIAQLADKSFADRR